MASRNDAFDRLSLTVDGVSYNDGGFVCVATGVD